MAHASGFLIRYLFPLRRGAHDVVYVLSIRRAAQAPLEIDEYTKRFMREAASAYA